MRMPHLKTVTLNIGRGSTYFARSFKEMLVPVSGENALQNAEPPGFRHFLPLLIPFTSSEKYDIKSLQELGIPIAKTLNEEFRVSALDGLCMSGVSWLALQQLHPVMSVLPVALAKVKTLLLAFNTGEMGLDESGAEVEDCAHYLRESNVLHKFLSACPSLTQLKLEFGSISSEAQAASLEHVVGRTTWRRLRQIAFCNFKIPAERFYLFVERHRGTVRDVILEDMCIGRPPETWSSLLSDIRHLNIPWERFRALGDLHHDGVPDLCVSVGSSSPETGPDAAQMIEDYVMKKTDFDPLQAVVTNDQTGETIWHGEWEDVSDSDETEVTEA